MRPIVKAVGLICILAHDYRPRQEPHRRMRLRHSRREFARRDEYTPSGQGGSGGQRRKRSARGKDRIDRIGFLTKVLQDKAAWSQQPQRTAKPTVYRQKQENLIRG